MEPMKPVSRDELRGAWTAHKAAEAPMTLESVHSATGEMLAAGISGGTHLRAATGTDGVISGLALTTGGE